MLPWSMWFLYLFTYSRWIRFHLSPRPVTAAVWRGFRLRWPFNTAEVDSALGRSNGSRSFCTVANSGPQTCLLDGYPFELYKLVKYSRMCVQPVFVRPDSSCGHSSHHWELHLFTVEPMSCENHNETCHLRPQSSNFALNLCLSIIEPLYLALTWNVCYLFCRDVSPL